jgi:hypothetical protein
MIKDINPPVVEDIAVAIVKEKNEDDEMVWNVYFVNMKDQMVEGVIVTSTGYGMHQNEHVKTSTLRHFLDEVSGKSVRKIEPIVETLFGLNNEYWVSFYVNKVMYDKKFIFLAETIKEEYFTLVPILNKKGVMIK